MGACVRLSPAVNRTSEDLLTGRGYGSNTSTKGGTKACMDQMMTVIECLGKFNQNQSMCTKEISAFQSCYSNFKVQYEKNRAFRESGELPTGSRVKMTGTQMNQYMNKFMPSSRTGQTNPISSFN